MTPLYALVSVLDSPVPAEWREVEKEIEDITDMSSRGTISPRPTLTVNNYGFAIDNAPIKINLFDLMRKQFTQLPSN